MSSSDYTGVVPYYDSQCSFMPIAKLNYLDLTIPGTQAPVCYLATTQLFAISCNANNTVNATRIEPYALRNNGTIQSCVGTKFTVNPDLSLKSYGNDCIKIGSNAYSSFYIKQPCVDNRFAAQEDVVPVVKDARLAVGIIMATVFTAFILYPFIQDYREKLK